MRYAGIAIALAAALMCATVSSAMAVGEGGRSCACPRYSKSRAAISQERVGGARSGGQFFVDADGDGVCDNAGAGVGARAGSFRIFVDADGDGVCDNAGTGVGSGTSRDAQAMRGAGNGYRGGRP